ncbi:MAG: hypothetical protein OSA99_19920 [Acidimicrobiales bacterium]|nr:hypothetical protein [Acidimicrobiales bacterium]
MEQRNPRPIRRGGLAVGVLGISALLPSTIGVAGAQTAEEQTADFAYTGAAEAWIVPVDVTCVEVVLVGGRGGDGVPSPGAGPAAVGASRAAAGGEDPVGGLGGNGGSVTATVNVSPGDELSIFVGGRGSDAANDFEAGNGGAGGTADGGAGGSGLGEGGGGGGGSSSVSIDGEAVAIAGAGGGAGGNGPDAVGANGGDGGEVGSDGAAGAPIDVESGEKAGALDPGQASPQGLGEEEEEPPPMDEEFLPTTGTGGGGGTQTGPGAGGTVTDGTAAADSPGQDGSGHDGGAGGGAGGGGGGYFGGGGGFGAFYASGGGGGGGSNLGPAGAVHASGVTTPDGNGTAELTWTPGDTTCVPTSTTEDDDVAGTGVTAPAPAPAAVAAVATPRFTG